MVGEKLLTNIEVKEISIVPYGANNKEFLLVKGTENYDINKVFWLQKEQIKNGADSMVNEEELKKQKLEADRIEKEKLEKEQFAKEQLEKSAKEAIEKAETLAKETEELRKQLAEKDKTIAEKDTLSKQALEIAKTERDARITKEKVDFAKDNYGYLGDSKEIGVFLKSAEEKLSKEEFELIGKIFAGANEKIKKGNLFEEIGKDSTQTSSGNVIEKVNKMASELMKNNADLSYGDAVAKIFDGDDSLYKEYIKAGGN